MMMMINRRHLILGAAASLASAGFTNLAGSPGFARPRDVIVPQTWLGVFVRDDPTDLDIYESWLGQSVSQLGVFVGEANWADFNAVWLVDMWKKRAPHLRLHWSVPLLVQGATLAGAASGAYNRHYTRVAREIDEWPGGEELYVRIGWEFNYSWMLWAAAGKEANFKQAYRNMVNCFRRVSSRFRFEWCPNIGNGRAASALMSPAAAYPGNSYVDVIGLDTYYFQEWDNPDPVSAFASMRDRAYGLKWHLNFAKSCRKPIAFSEWGINSDNKADYVFLFHDWMVSNGALWHNYWNRQSGTDCRLSNGQYPNTADGYVFQYGDGGFRQLPQQRANLRSTR